MGGGPRGGGQVGGEDILGHEEQGLCEPGVSGESKVNVGLTQGSALSPLLFIALMKLISRKIFVQKTYSGNNCTQMHGLAVVADGVSNLQEQLIEWKDMFSRLGLRVCLEKTGET